jgi:pyridoxal phosphate enzyme (YggS family)
MTTTTVAQRLDAVREQIALAAKRSGRDATDVTLVAVSKTVDAPRIAEAVTAGQRVFGENRAQELLAHAAEIDDDGVEWHFIGTLQRNKVRALAAIVACWHSIDRPELVAEVAKRAPAARAFVEVNIGEEPQKSGCAPDATRTLVALARDAGLRVEGLMAVPPAGRDPRPYFRRLRSLSDDLGLRELSMGMSGDFEVAIEEGATVVRVGSAVFGPRPTSPNARR